MAFILLLLYGAGLLLAALLALTALVVVHEFGHFIIAKKSGVWVEEFGVGLPPRVWSKKIGETLYSVNAIPLGGFVRMHGETGNDEVYDPSRAFINKHPFKKVLIVLAGIVMNFLFGILCFSIIYSFIGIPKLEALNHVEITDIAPNSAAQTAGILAGDIVKTINTQEIKTNQEFISQIAQNRGKKINLILLRDNQEVKYTIALKDVPPEQGALGVVIRDSIETIYFPPLWQRPIVGAYYGVIQTYELTNAIIFGLGDVAQQAGQGKVPDGVAGPLKLFAILGYLIKEGKLLLIMGIISVNLAVFNILPIPPLDGSRLFVIIGEWLFGRKLSPKIENFVNTFGMALLLLLVVVVSFKEVRELLAAGSLAKFIENIIQ